MIYTKASEKAKVYFPILSSEEEKKICIIINIILLGNPGTLFLLLRYVKYILYALNDENFYFFFKILGYVPTFSALTRTLTQSLHVQITARSIICTKYCNSQETIMICIQEDLRKLNFL